MNKIAVIMSVYKHDDEKHLRESLESIYSQSFEDFDIFVQCDGILSEPLKNLLHDEVKANKIKYINYREDNLGLASSLNDLLRVVLERGYEFIARMDSDDICNESRFLKQYEYLQKNHTIDVIGSDIIEFHDDGSLREKNYPVDHELILKRFAYQTAIPHVTAMFRKSFFEKAGYYNENSNRNEDQWLWLAGFLNKCIFASIAEPLVKVRLSNNLLLRRSDFKHNFDTFKLRNKIVTDLKFSKILLIYNLLVMIIKSLPTPLLRIIYKLR